MISKLLNMFFDNLQRLNLSKLLAITTVYCIFLASFTNFYAAYEYNRFLLGYIELLVFIVIGCCIGRGDYFQRKRYVGYLMYLIWIVVTYLFRGDIYLLDDNNRIVFINQCIFCGIALPFSHVSGDTKARKHLDTLFGIMIFVVAFLLWLCFIGAFLGENILLMDGRFEFGVKYTYTGRMMLKVLALYYYHLGYLSVVCFFSALYMAVTHWSKITAPLWILLLATFSAGILLTYSRTGVFSFAGGLLLAFHIFLQNLPLSKSSRRRIFLIAIIAGIFLTGAGMNLIYSAVHSIRDIWYGISTFSSRTEIWGAIFQVLRDYTSSIVFGLPLELGMSIVNQYLPDLDYIANMHSGFLQTLLALGIPGFLCIIWFTLYLIRCSCRVFFTPSNCGITNSDKLLILIPAVSLFMALFESILFYGCVELTILNIINALTAGYIIETEWHCRHPQPSDAVCLPVSES